MEKKYNAYLTSEDVSRMCKSMDKKMSEIKTKSDAEKLLKRIGYDASKYSRGK